jgi:hypothetical protein
MSKAGFVYVMNIHTPPEKVRNAPIGPEMVSVRSTAAHGKIEPDSAMLRSISAGWPAVLSSLKTLLETGAALPMTQRCWGSDAQFHGE